MSRIYDSWEKLVGAVLKKLEDDEIALRESFSSSSSADPSSRFSFSSSFNPTAVDIHVPPEVSRNFCRNVMAIDYEEIKKATRNFRITAMIGEALFTLVFKGWIDEDDLTAKMPGCGIAVSVHMIDLERLQGYEEWVDGISCWSRLLHPNLVKLIGCSFDTHNRILVVHEFMPKGSLANILFRWGPDSLPWATRITVAVGAARALSFLHGLEIPVMHRNVMSSNILLDDDFNTKLLYFDLFKDGPQVMARHGYDAPEYIATGFCNI